MRRPEGLVSFEEAARRLGMSEGERDELVDAGALGTWAWMGDVFLGAEEVGKRASGIAVPAEARRLEAADDGRVRRIRGLMETGVRVVRAGMAAELLGILPKN